jgi:hypothetical protein
MIPMYIVAIVWLVALGIFTIAALFSILQMLRFGLAHFLTYATTVVFVAISVIIIGGSLVFLSQADFKTNLNLADPMGTVFPSPSI